MRKLLACFAIILTAITVVAAATDDKELVKKDLELLQGEWSTISASADGESVPEAMLRSFKRICKDNETTVKNGEQIIMKAKIAIDPSKKPKTIDYDVIDGPTKGKKHLGIYELEGDKLKSCFGAPDLERPGDFITKPGDKRALSVWKREKKE